MAKVGMNGFTVTNVESCPKCKSEQYARIDGVLNMVQICCDKCDYVADGALMLRGSANVYKEKERFIEMTRTMFNFWNKQVASFNQTEIKKVRILTHKH